MKVTVFLFLVAAVVVMSTSIGVLGNENNKRCTVNGRICHTVSDCCSGCCSTGVCASPDRCSAATQGSCAVHYCPPDKECYLQNVQCITAPCPPVPACRPKNNDYDNYD